MNAITKTLVFSASLALLLAGGCASDTSSAPKPAPAPTAAAKPKPVMMTAPTHSGFLSDYSKLKTRSAHERVFIVPALSQGLKQVHAVMVDQPEVFIAPDSKYKGAKPDQLKALSDSLRMAIVEQLQGAGYTTTETSGPNVLYIRWAITDLYLKKKKRGFLSYTPIGFVVHETRQAAIKDLAKKIDVVELNVEAEFLDGRTGDVLAAAVLSQGQRKTDAQKAQLVSWEELDATMVMFGERVACNLDNARKALAQRKDCSQIAIKLETS